VRGRDARATTLSSPDRQRRLAAEETTSMIRRIVGGVPLGAAETRGAGRSDLAMNVLQYGTAIVAIVVVTLLAVVR
jgi:hypothetical protein